eukprot:TRINITY_DN448_c0_g1_i1.p1 TRINITY_DN448_c0_g1~~TRINITY_DN448_c0_g1_i1.p1  ORF type:complete len:96 (-),score=23.97 TRINITY_DN448_c0_g1_i1:123-410(-)
MTDNEFWKRFVYHLIRLPVEAPHIQQMESNFRLEAEAEEKTDTDVSGSLKHNAGCVENEKVIDLSEARDESNDIDIAADVFVESGDVHALSSVER